MKKSILLFILFCVINNLNAQTKTFHSNGKLKAIGFYDVQHHKTGEWKQYDLDGNLNEIGFFVNGEKNGEWKTFYKNELTSSKNYKNGKKDGNWSYYQNGKLKQIEHYINGKASGVSKSIRENGTLIYIRYYDNGKPIGEHKEYYESGKIKKVTTFINGKTTSIKNYYESGGLSATKLLLKNKKIQAKSFYDDGSIGSVAYIQNFKGWNPIGTVKHYHQNGKLHYKVKYSYTKTTRTKGYYVDGKRKFKGYKKMLEHKGNYDMEPTGKWKYYNQNGKLQKIEIWANGKLVTTENNEPNKN